MMDYRKDVLVYSQDDVQKIWKYYHMTGKSVKEAVEILRRWAEQQRHLPQNQDNDFFERLLARNKFRIEQTKQKIDGYYSLRGLYKEFYQKCNDEFVPTREQAILIPMPLLTKNQERIVCMRLENLDPVTYDPYRIAKYMFLVCEVLWREDYSVGEKFIIDCQGATFDHMKKVTLPLLVKAFDIYRGIYSGRLISMDIINAPVIVNILLSLFKMVLPAKIFNRIKVHNDVESLQQSYYKKYLPKDYGGDLKSLDDMKKTWDKVFDDYRKFFDENYYNISDEALRIGDVPKNEIFGIEGTFKTLNLD